MPTASRSSSAGQSTRGLRLRPARISARSARRCGSRFSTVMVAECSSAIRCTIESPSPVLPCLRRSRRQKRRKISLRSSSLDARSAVEHADGAVVLDDEFDGRSRRGVVDGVFGEVADGAAEHFRIALDPDRLGRARQRDILALRQRQRRHELGDLGGDRPQIGLLVGLDRRSASSSAMSSSWLMMCAMPSTFCRKRLAASSGLPRYRCASAARSSGVRSSCAASAVKSRWTRNPSSSRSSPWLTAETSGRTSRGISPVGNRTPGRAGPMLSAISEACRSGRSARRKIAMSAISSTSRIGSVIQPTFW